MNVALPIILIIIANLVIYWIFFGNKDPKKKSGIELFGNSNKPIFYKKKFEEKIEKEVNKNAR
jgi:hypothetical protein